MACRLIDSYSYGRHDKKPEIPREPMCIPAKLFTRLIITKLVILAICIAVLIPVTKRLENPPAASQASGQAQTEAAPQKASEKKRAFPTVFLWIVVFGAAGAVISIIEQKLYNGLRDPMKNPRGWRHQGRLLDEQEAHYRLHLSYYRLHKTWVLPDELEYSADDGAAGYECGGVPADTELRI